MPQLLTTDEMFEAMQELADGDVMLLKHRREYMVKPPAPGVSSWYLRLPGVEISTGCILRSCGASGSTPTAAIEATWRALSELSHAEYIVVHAMDPARRRAHRWNGSRWVTVKESISSVVA
jgi:hypothetical protein